MTSYFAIGLMSGTSLDGLDLCYAKFTQNNSQWNFEIIFAETIPYNDEWKRKLQQAIFISSEDLLALDKQYGFYLGEKTAAFIHNHNIEKVDVIASHGHTVFHQPERNFTLQIGDGRAIKIVTQHPVVYDFRSQDVLMGGNGAPLVPIGDQLLFSEYDACLNLGGFSNISFLQNEKRIAFDISPVNIVLNEYAEQLGYKYDKDGNLAQKGSVNTPLLNALNALDYYHKNPPKSLGIEMVKKEITPLLSGDCPENILTTFTEHIAVQIATTITNLQLKQVLVTGGGSFNKYLIQKIREKSQSKIILPKDEIIHFKEALIFALMGVLRIQEKINVLHSATGSYKDHSSGIIA